MGISARKSTVYLACGKTEILELALHLHRLNTVKVVSQLPSSHAGLYTSYKHFYYYDHLAGFKTVLYFITARSLHSMDMNSGDLMETVSLPEGYKFSGLSIDDETHLLAVSSQKNCSASKEDVLLAFALFECYPQLSFQELLQVWIQFKDLSILAFL